MKKILSVTIAIVLMVVTLFVGPLGLTSKAITIEESHFDVFEVPEIKGTAVAAQEGGDTSIGIIKDSLGDLILYATKDGKEYNFHNLSNTLENLYPTTDAYEKEYEIADIIYFANSFYISGIINTATFVLSTNDGINISPVQLPTDYASSGYECFSPAANNILSVYKDNVIFIPHEYKFNKNENNALTAIYYVSKDMVNWTEHEIIISSYSYADNYFLTLAHASDKYGIIFNVLFQQGIGIDGVLMGVATTDFETYTYSRNGSFGNICPDKEGWGYYDQNRQVFQVSQANNRLVHFQFLYNWPNRIVSFSYTDTSVTEFTTVFSQEISGLTYYAYCTVPFTTFFAKLSDGSTYIYTAANIGDSVEKYETDIDASKITSIMTSSLHGKAIILYDKKQLLISEDGFLNYDTIDLDEEYNNFLVVDKYLLLVGNEKSLAIESVDILEINDLSGWVLDGNNWVYYENGYTVANTWRADSNGWCYLDSDGHMVKNDWVYDSGKWYFLDSNGYMISNKWMADSKGWCYVGANGYIVKNNWVIDGGKWYFLDANGYMVSNAWKKDSHGWVYLGYDGTMVTNQWVKDSLGWCFVGADGYAVTNTWKRDSNGWCYLGASGSQVKNNWVWDGAWYYIDANGYMLSNTSKWIKNKTYNFNASGVCTNP